jgi:hypothetical protein
VLLDVASKLVRNITLSWLLPHASIVARNKAFYINISKDSCQVWPEYNDLTKTKPINTTVENWIIMKKSVNGINLNRINGLLDRLNFLHILIIWIGILLFFGLLYYFLSGESTYLVYNLTREKVSGLFDSIYFSFITATSTGFGDVIPMGYFKLFAIIEVVFGLVLLAIVTSKLVSIKQDVIMNEIYEISFYEKINRIRSSLLLFRQNVGRVITNIESNSIRKREISDLYNYLSSFEDSLKEISDLITRQPSNNFTKVLDQMSTELILNSINQSFEKLTELIMLMINNKIEWKREIAIKIIEECMMINNSIFDGLQKAGIISEKEFIDIIIQNRRSTEPIKKCLKEDTKFCDIDLEKI